MNYIRRHFQNLAIKKNKIYVLPTRQGYFFFGSIVIIFFMGLVYGNNMCFLLSFLMVGQFVIALFQSHNNIKNFELEDFKVKDTYLGEDFEIDFIAKNNQSAEELVIKMNDDSKWAFVHKENKLFTNPFEERGKISFDFVSYESTYPFNLFRTWRYLKKETTIFLYPRLLKETSLQEDEYSQSNQGFYEIDADFQELKPYSRGESFRRIDWKKYAMTDRLFWKKFTSRAEEKIHLVLEEIDFELERKLSFIASIIKLADKNHKEWEVHIKSDKFSSPHDYQNLLRRLSEYKE